MTVRHCLSVIASVLASAPALACDTGPFAVEFPAGTAHLGSNAKRDIAFVKKMVQPPGAGQKNGLKLEIAFYILDQKGRRTNATLWETRQQEIEFYLKSIGTSRTSYQIVFRPSFQKPKLSIPGRIQRTDVTVNLAGAHC
jgi:hypothetical protein